MEVIFRIVYGRISASLWRRKGIAMLFSRICPTNTSKAIYPIKIHASLVDNYIGSEKACI